MPDDVKEMLGLPVSNTKRAKSEPRTPKKQIIDKNVILMRNMFS